MAFSSQVRVVLDLDLDADLICGSISTADRAAHRFFGWLELANELEVMRKCDPDDSSSRPQAQPAQA